MESGGLPLKGLRCACFHLQSLRLQEHLGLTVAAALEAETLRSCASSKRQSQLGLTPRQSLHLHLQMELWKCRQSLSQAKCQSLHHLLKCHLHEHLLVAPTEVEVVRATWLCSQTLQDSQQDLEGLACRARQCDRTDSPVSSRCVAFSVECHRRQELQSSVMLVRQHTARQHCTCLRTRKPS